MGNIVLKGDLPEGLRSSAEMYAGCVSGAIRKDDYLNLVKAAGFVSVKVQKERKIAIPDEILSVYLDHRELEEYKAGEPGVYSVNLYAVKPMPKAENEACCEPGCCSN